ncbi:MAG: prolyl oligopeptidase family serine peptidase [Candidatus Marinimicrobia bacterium]|nr:prolyl oligopeptidase family serine peptidase [Candidatus Neomarinimicrobiota bacterium]
MGLGDRYAFIYDRYDIWKFDLSGEKAPLNVTRGTGRDRKIVYRYHHLDPELDYAPIKPVILSAFNEKTKENGFAGVRFYEGSVPEHLVYSDHKYNHLEKAEDADVLIWRKGSYRIFPDLWVSDMDFDTKVKVSALNPQQSEYRWADVELVEWKNSDGVELQGMLYIPDGLDTDKKHPMIIYYYEKYSDYLHQYFMPQPSYSTINKTMYPSNGYIVFIPDIVYEVGHPGKSGLDCVETGLDMLLKEYPFIDEDKVALQGQSWGGYQTAYFITQTDRFAAGMAGAPVSNMTSAYGGIRWFSGLSRMMQYEGGQSRIGGTLWDRFDLYVENSPVFFADRINTPLLIMHNDNDGAVPWTQGIEMFVAMRRLQKPAWMLVYNNDSHNLKRASWGNRMDLTVRMKQFFDHYLRDEPMPLWMKEGIPATEKGRELKYKLTE